MLGLFGKKVIKAQRFWSGYNMLKANEYPAEIARVKKIIKNTDSPTLKRDSMKYLKRLKKELKEYERLRGNENA